MGYTPNPFNYTGDLPNEVENDLNLANDNFNILAQAFVNNDPTTLKVKNASNADNANNADTVDGYHASQTPAPNVIPVTDANGVLSPDWIPSMFDSVRVISPSANTIYQETAPCLIMVISQDLYGLELSPDGSTWYGKFGQEHYSSSLEGGVITFYVPKLWYWRFSNVIISTSSDFSAQYWLKFIFKY